MGVRGLRAWRCFCGPWGKWLHMVINYLKIAWRNLVRNKVFSAINILGLGLGLGCSILILLWVRDELAVDGFHANRNRLYGVYERVFSEGKLDAGPYTPGLLARELKRLVPEVEMATAFDHGQAGTFSVGVKIFNLQGADADSDFFRMFSYPLLEGSAASALSSVDGIALSKSAAERFFGSPATAIGKPIRWNDFKDFRVTAVYADPPPASSVRFDFVLNWSFHLQNVDWLNHFIYRGGQTFILLKPHADAARVEAKITHFLDAYLQHGAGNGYHLELGLQRADQLYLHSVFKGGRPAGGRIDYLRLFIVVALFVLFIACCNFMNLATARSLRRAREVGIRKTVGALRGGLIAQFIGEALLLTAVAIGLALLLVAVALPSFNSLTGKQIALPLGEPVFWTMLGALWLVTGLLSGSYPAVFLSSLRPVKVLKGNACVPNETERGEAARSKFMKFSLSALWMRKGLVTVQFVLSVLLISGTLIISRQVNFLQTQDPGFNRSNLVYVPFQGDLAQRYAPFKEQLTGMPGIAAVTRTNQPPERTVTHGYDLSWPGKDANTRVVVIHCAVGYNYFRTLGVPVVMGREFSPAYPTDTGAFMINETAMKLMGMADPVGKNITFFAKTGKIVGVVRDFHFNSLHDPIQPLVVFCGEDYDWGYALIRTEPGKTREALASLSKVYKQMEPKFPFTWLFPDEEYQKMYRSEQLAGKLSRGFAVLAVVISCMGLLGLALFTAEQRTKEIGIRKVIGASSGSIVVLLSRDVLRLVVLAALIATPVAWIVMGNWLRDYAYRVSISWMDFAVAGGLAVGVALLTVAWQALRAAGANPVRALRAE
jgi:putative ABC transport system permease protein